jgi:cytochrome c2
MVFLVLLLLPGAAVPARRSLCLACHGSHYAERGSCVDCHRGNDRTDRKEIAHHDLIAGTFAQFTIKGRPIVEQGRKLVEVLACRRCHRFEGKGNGLATDLGRLATNTAPQDMFDSIKSPVLFMPDFQFDDTQIVALVNAILAGAEPAGAQVGETAQVIHFENEKQGRENSFVKRCGPCHKSLSERFGGLGNGDIGPNLSGLFSEFYPGTYPDAEAWTPDKLRKWVENPRRIRANARMMPVRLTADEFEQLTETLRSNTDAYPPIPAGALQLLLQGDTVR